MGTIRLDNEDTTPDTPEEGKTLLYVDSNKEAKQLDDTGEVKSLITITFTETEAGGASIASGSLLLDSAFFYISSGGSGLPILSLKT
jgi:hypothetical protein